MKSHSCQRMTGEARISPPRRATRKYSRKGSVRVVYERFWPGGRKRRTGFARSSKRTGAFDHATVNVTASAISETISRRRNSSRCSKNPIRGSSSLSFRSLRSSSARPGSGPAGPTSLTDRSGRPDRFGGRWDGVRAWRFRSRRRRGGPADGRGDRVSKVRGLLANRGNLVLDRGDVVLSLFDLVLDRPLQVLRSLPELRQAASERTAELRELPRPENEQGNQKNQDEFGHSNRAKHVRVLREGFYTGPRRPLHGRRTELSNRSPDHRCRRVRMIASGAAQ